MLEPQAAKRRREGCPRVSIRPLELREARREPLRVGEGYERPLEACPPKEPHCGRIQLRRIGARNQDEQRRSFVQIDVLEIERRGPSRQEVSTGDRTTKTSQWRSLRRHEHMFA